MVTSHASGCSWLLATTSTGRSCARNIEICVAHTLIRSRKIAQDLSRRVRCRVYDSNGALDVHSPVVDILKVTRRLSVDVLFTLARLSRLGFCPSRFTRISCVVQRRAPLPPLRLFTCDSLSRRIYSRILPFTLRDVPGYSRRTQQAS